MKSMAEGLGMSSPQFQINTPVDAVGPFLRPPPPSHILLYTICRILSCRGPHYSSQGPLGPTGMLE